MGGRVVLLTNSSWVGEALAQRLLLAGIDLRLIVREDVVDPIHYSLPSRVARAVLGNAIMDRIGRSRLSKEVQDTLVWEKRLYKATEEWMENERAARGISVGWPSGIPFVLTHSANEPEVVDRVRAERPDLLVVFGTRLLKAPLLSLPSRGALNAHSSLLPHYKGPRSEFWQCYHDDLGYAGITIHQVTPGVDDGAILFQCPAQTTSPRDPYRLRAVNTFAVLEHFPRVVSEFLAGAIHPVAQGPTHTPVYRFRDVTMEKRMELRARSEER